MSIKLNTHTLDQQLLNWSRPNFEEPFQAAKAMQLAFDVALKGLGQVSPNPLVGATLLDSQSRFVATAAHLKYGSAHAEQNLIQMLQDQGLTHKWKDAVLYVTLEPCAHQGKTPSCALHLSKLGFKKVVYAVQDPNPLVAGKGIAILKAAGIEVEQAFGDEAQARRLNDVFFHHFNHKRPFVALKAAQSLDGSIAYHGDQKKFISNDMSRLYGHFLRQKYDAIVVGPKTVILDNPNLNVRYAKLAEQGIQIRDPKLVLFDPRAQILSSLAWQNIESLKSKRQVFWVLPDSALIQKNFERIKTEMLEAQPEFKISAIFIDAELAKEKILPREALEFVLIQLYMQGVFSLLVEGGAGLYQVFLQAGSVDKLHLFYSTEIMIGGGRVPFVLDAGEQRKIILKDRELTLIEDNFLLEAYIS
ncbi:MAG: bifunctional diaminohydroxyphosphoribosylaminopyrimidine deaminase/5-amino-6-(5-phosphoribosylamino)uracil reductase RibD [Oligoflexales bacterium]|nr:bifunctional diaminohydroxyphosphoribosylaminopyrimidine deaminase/5-amino-6-(5-phosphoribosylamino)uracil reductase RibD [Oligoflexales bacterium]